MAKQSFQPSGRSKFRLLYIDGDLTTGDLRELTQAITGALKPVSITAKTQIQQKSSIEEEAIDQTNGNGHTEEVENAEIEHGDEGGMAETPKPPSNPRKYRSPKVVNDLDMKSGGKAFG